MKRPADVQTDQERVARAIAIADARYTLVLDVNGMGEVWDDHDTDDEHRPESVMICLGTHASARAFRQELVADAVIAAMAGGGWQDISTAPQDRLIEVFAPGGEYDLPDICCCCQWHEDAGFCVDELLHPTHWREFRRPLPVPPTSHPEP